MNWKDEIWKADIGGADLAEVEETIGAMVAKSAAPVCERDDVCQDALCNLWQAAARYPQRPACLAVSIAVRDALVGRCIHADRRASADWSTWQARRRIERERRESFERRAALALIDADL